MVGGSARSLGVLWLMGCVGCGGVDDVPGDEGGTGTGSRPNLPSNTPAPGEGLEYTFGSLDVSSLDTQSASWCEPPDFTPSGYTGLDRATLAQTLADYTRGWMTPLHESLLGLDEVDLFDAFFETVFATYHTDCDWNDPADLEVLPPPEGELLDPENQQDVYDDVERAILEAELLSEGEEVQLVLRECEDCPEGLAEHPLTFSVRMTTDGVLVGEMTREGATAWVRKWIVTPDAAVFQVSLDETSAWWTDVAAATPDVEDVMPLIRGVVTAVVRKNNAGGVSATLGVSSLSFDAQPGESQTVWGEALGDCIGVHAAISGSTGEAQAAAELGSFMLTIPGSVNCDVSECGEKEQQENWVYTLGGVSMTAEQPGPASADDLHVNVVAKNASTARVGNDEFARGGIGKQGNGGHLGLSVDKTAEGFYVTFEPALALGGAMTISSFSDHLRMNLPDWLQDEIFDVTFGGDPRSQVFVPARPPCVDDPNQPEPPRPARRNVEIVSGNLEVLRANDTLMAGPGTCVGQTLADESQLVSTSDWVEVGYSCP